jgi:hypothetical protein
MELDDKSVSLTGGLPRTFPVLQTFFIKIQSPIFLLKNFVIFLHPELFEISRYPKSFVNAQVLFSESDLNILLVLIFWYFDLLVYWKVIHL